MSSQAATPPDQTRTFASLAKALKVPAAEIATLYEHERNKLASAAHVTKFLHIFAIRNVLEILRQRAAAHDAMAGSSV